MDPNQNNVTSIKYLVLIMDQITSLGNVTNQVEILVKDLHTKDNMNLY